MWGASMDDEHRSPLDERYSSRGSDDGAIADEPASRLMLYPSRAHTHLPRGSEVEPAHARLDLILTAPAVLDPQIDGTSALLMPEAEYGALLAGPWKPATRVPVEGLAASVLDNMRGAVVVLDADLRVRLANHAFCEMFQVVSGEIDDRWLPELGAGR